MWQRIYELKNQGMDTTRLEQVVVGDVNTAAKVFTDYDSRLPKLAALWNRLYTIDFRGFEAEYQMIYSRLKDPFALEELTQMMDRLDKAVTERQKAIQEAYEAEQKKRELELKRYNLEQVIMSWKSRGYKVDELEALLKTDVDKCREAVAKFEATINLLWDIGKRLQVLDYRGFETEFNEIRALLHDTTKADEAKVKLEILEKKVQEKVQAQQADWQAQMLQRQQWEEQKKKEEQVKLQEEARKAAEARLQAQADWEKKLTEEKQAVAKARLYFSRVSAHMRETPPEYSPLGFYLGDHKFAVDQDLDKLEVTGKVSINLFQDHLFMVCHFMSAASLPQVSDLVNYFKRQGEDFKTDGKYRVDCVVMNRVSQPCIDAVVGFSHSNCAALLYDIADDKIYFNPKDVGADAYAGAFLLNSKPKTLAEIFKPVADKYDVYYAKDIVANYGMSAEEVDKMMKHLEGQNKIFPVEKRAKSFSFA